jgi:transposase
MIQETVKVRRVERVDDIPVLLAALQQMNAPALLDRHFPSCHRWKGELTFGEVSCVWLSFILSQGDHRLNSLQPWAEDRLHTLSACLGKSVRSLDFQDDRLADILERLAAEPDQSSDAPSPWDAFQVDLNRNSIRVYNLAPTFFRVDTTTANSYAEVIEGLGYIQFGHSKDRDDLGQIKIALATLDPLGMPVTTVVVPGNCADDPLYIPQIQQVQQSFGKGGKTYVTDCKGSALATRAYVASTGDYYLTPLSESQLSAGARHALLQPVFAGDQPLQQVHRPGEDGKPAELVAEGFFVDVPLTATVDGKLVSWTERRWVVRSLAYAQGSRKQLQRRLDKAQQQLQELNERKQGKKRLTAQEMAEAAAEIVDEQRVDGMVCWEVKTTTSSRKIRGYRGQPARSEKEQEHRVEVWIDEAEIKLAEREMGWRVYAANNLQMSLAAVVWGYRGQDRLEDNFARLKGRPLGLTPMYLQYEDRIVGLVLLLSLALRLLSVLEWTVRKKLLEEGKTLKGLYAGQAGRQTKRPTAELLLKAFTGISLTVLEVAGLLVTQILPLNALQQHLLLLWNLPSNLYSNLVLLFPQPPPC